MSKTFEWNYAEPKHIIETEATLFKFISFVELA